MKRALVLASLLLIPLVAGCCPLAPRPPRPAVVGSGRLETRQLDLDGFTRIEAGHAFTLEITQADDYQVSVTADDNLSDYLDVSVSGDTLRLRLQPIRSYGRTTLRAQIAMPSLRGLQLSGASRAEMTGFRSADDLTLALSGASSLQGEIEAGSVRLEESGASRVELTGSGRDLHLNSSGASTTRLLAFPVRDANVALSGASQAELNVSGRLDAEASGGSRLEYTGNPTLGRTNTSGGASIRAR